MPFTEVLGLKIAERLETPDRPTLTWTEDDVGRAIFYYDRKLNENFLSVTA